jgi:hypothetical protein
MSDTSGNFDPAEVLEDVIDGATDVQDDRQAETPCEFQLRNEEGFLAREIGVRDEEVEADLADGDCIPSPQPLFDKFQVVIPRLADVERMDAVSVAYVGMGCSKRRNRIEVGDFDAWNDETSYACGAGGGQEGVAVAVEFCCVEMDVGINEHVT